MFGEMIGIGIADLWSRTGSPAFRYVELGPGRGTLAVDALRVMARFGCVPQGVHLVETSPALREAQLARLPAAGHHDEVDALPDDTPLLIVANEFFDALPIHQYVRTTGGWRELMVERIDGGLAPAAGDIPADDAIPVPLRGDRAGTIVENAPPAAASMPRCAFPLARHRGAMPAIYPCYPLPAAGDTLPSDDAPSIPDTFA